jgi:transposase
MKIPKQAYTEEYKELAVKRVKGGQALTAVAKELGLVEHTLRNGVKAAAAGKLAGAGSKAVTPEAMELSRLRAENLRRKRTLEIIKNVAAYCAKDALCSTPGWPRIGRSSPWRTGVPPWRSVLAAFGPGSGAGRQIAIG